MPMEIRETGWKVSMKIHAPDGLTVLTVILPLVQDESGYVRIKNEYAAMTMVQDMIKSEQE